MAATDQPNNPSIGDVPKKPSKVSALWRKLGLDAITIILMAKGALPPAIFTAMYQSNTIAQIYGAQGYLVTIIATISLCILPRAKLMQLTVQNLIAICLAAATSLFGLWTATRARANNPSAPGNPFNGSAAAVSAIWLFVNIWMVNVFRAKAPQLAIPTIMYTIFSSIVFSNGALLDMTRAINTIILLLKAFLTGFAISLAVGLLIVPANNRQVWWKILGGYLETSRALLNEQKNFLQKHESLSAYDLPASSQSSEAETTHGPNRKKAPVIPIRPLAALQKVHSDLFAKLSLELPMAKREMALGHYTTTDLSEVFRLIRATILPLQGMTAILDIFDRVMEQPVATENGESRRKEQFAEVMKTLHQPYEMIIAMCDETIEHTLLLLGLKPLPKKKGDEENGVQVAGYEGFTVLLEERVQEFYNTRTSDIQKYFSTQEPLDPDSIVSVIEGGTPPEPLNDTRRSQLYLVLFMEYLLFSAAQSLLDLARFAENKKQEGILDKKRLVYPSYKRLKKCIFSNDGNDDVVDVGDIGGTRKSGISKIMPMKDPDHLPASTSMHKIGTFIAFLSGIISSSDSAWALRVACATIAVALPAFFQESYVFFNEKRIVWAMIIIAIGMSPTSGASLIGFVGRIAGTIIAMVLAFINWYIVDGNTAGVIVFLWFFVALQFYFIIKQPQTIQSVFTAMVTHIMIIGYELQVRKIGREASEVSGQPVLGINLIGPYRLLVTTAGLGVAFFFTIFPYPVTTRSLIRQDVSGALYLLARSYSNAISLVRMRVDGTEGDPESKKSHGQTYEKERVRLMTESIIALDSLRKNSAFTVFEPSLRGKFPKEQYDVIIESCSNITNYLAIISYASRTFTHKSSSNQAWVSDLSALIKTVDLRSHQVTSLLCLLSTSVGNGQPLPPFLAVPEPFRLSKALEERDPRILGLDHLKEPGYMAFAVMQVATSVMYVDLKKLIRMVETLVGQVEFPHEYDSNNSSLSSLKSKVV